MRRSIARRRGSLPSEPGSHLYIAVDDLEAALQRAQDAGADGPGPLDHAASASIETRPWGERSFYLRDPFGNPLCFVDARTTFTGARA